MTESGQSGAWPSDDSGLFERGTVFDGKYEITGFIGRGGFGTVYEGRQGAIGRKVAIKVLLPSTDARTRDRFLQEARVVAAIDHPNVVVIHDFGVHDDKHPYIVMERLDGWALEDSIDRQGPLEHNRALRLFCGALEALGEAHKLGIVHKDLKPSNLFVVHPGRRKEMLKVLDFGVARITADGSEQAPHSLGSGGQTQQGQTVGTPQYMAPEYINDQIATPALDVYQMGLILCEALSGAPVVNAETPWASLIVHAKGDLEIPQVVKDDPALLAIVEKALAKDHTARYPDCGAFAHALETLPGIGGGRPVVSRAVDVPDGLTSTSMPTRPEHHVATEVIPARGGWIKWAVLAAALVALGFGVLTLAGGAAFFGMGAMDRAEAPDRGQPKKAAKKKGSKASKKSEARVSELRKVKGLSSLTPKKLRKRIARTEWKIFRVDKPESFEGFVVVLNRADFQGASITLMKSDSADEARLSGEALLINGDSAGAVEGRHLMLVAVSGADTPDDAEKLLRALLRD